MMWIAIIICFAIEDWADGGVVLFLHAFNSSLGFYESMKAGDAVKALKAALAPVCNCKRDGEWRRLAARELVPGDLIILKIGDVVPADGVLCEGGTCDLDQSGLTGESLPVKKCPGDMCYSGTVVKRGEQDMIVQYTGEKTEMGKGVALIQSVESKGQVEVIMNKITLFLLCFALFMNVLLVIVEITTPSTLNKCKNTDHEIQGCEKSESRKIISNFVVLMIAAIPIATPVVVTATMAIGARKMAQAHAVVTKLSSIEELAGMTVLCSDKTGTLTKNVLTIDTPYMFAGFDWEDMIFKAALAAKAVDPDAIDKVCRDSVKDQARLNSFKEVDFLPFDPVIKRTEATVEGPDGTIIKVTKGAPQVIVALSHNPDEIREEVQEAMEMFASKGLRPVAVAEYVGEKWHFMGMMSLFDPPRDDTKIVIESAIKYGASVKMITGDHQLIAKETCRRLGMGDSIMKPDSLKLPESRLLQLIEDCDGFAEVFPEDKFDIVALFQKKGHITGMTGDGVNDAPALRKANVGFAVEGATAAAQGAADCILLTPGLSVIITAIERSRKIFQRLQNYLIYRVFMSVYLLTFFFVAIAWADLDFPTLIIIIMCLILDLSTMSLAYDKVIPSPLPNRWNLQKIIGVACVMGVVATLGSLFFLGSMRNNYFSMSVWQRGYPTSCSAWSIGNDDGSCSYLGELFGSSVFQYATTVDYDAATQEDPNPYRVWPLPSSMNFCANLGNNPAGKCGIAQSKNYLFVSSANSAGFRAGPQESQSNLNILNTWSYFPNIKSVPHYGYTGFNTSDPTTMQNGEPLGMTQLSVLGFSIESGDDKLWDPRYFPYSSAVENTALFLLLCLVTQLSVLSARVDGWFFTRRPGYVLLSIISTEMICTTIAAAVMRPYPFWYPNTPTETVRLTGIDGRYIGVCWLWAILVFFVMEVAKYAVYYGIDLSRTQQIQAEKRQKLKEELRRRMTMVSSAGKPAYVPAGAAHGAGGSGLAPQPLGGRTYSTKGKDAELAQPLLSGDNYAAAH
jgi:H+-transporting ATPase